MSMDKNIAGNDYPKKSTADRQHQNQDEFETQRPSTPTPDSDLVNDNSDGKISEDRENEEQRKVDREIGSPS